jgi:hypothetical protein
VISGYGDIEFLGELLSRLLPHDPQREQRLAQRRLDRVREGRYASVITYVLSGDSRWRKRRLHLRATEAKWAGLGRPRTLDRSSELKRPRTTAPVTSEDLVTFLVEDTTFSVGKHDAPIIKKWFE